MIQTYWWLGTSRKGLDDKKACKTTKATKPWKSLRNQQINQPRRPTREDTKHEEPVTPGQPQRSTTTIRMREASRSHVLRIKTTSLGPNHKHGTKKCQNTEENKTQRLEKQNKPLEEKEQTPKKKTTSPNIKSINIPKSKLLNPIWFHFPKKPPCHVFLCFLSPILTKRRTPALWKRKVIQ